MTIEQFKNNIDNLFPICWEHNFVDVLQSIFNQYCHWINQLTIASNDVLYINNICKQILEIISLYENNKDKAFRLFYSLLYGNDNNGLSSSIGHVIINKGQLFYRARHIEPNIPFSRLDMFHISQDKRDIVKSQRYNHSGFPCLYMGLSILSCWMEMRQPNWDNLYFSAFKACTSFPVFDMRVPSIEDYDNYHLLKTIERIPLIIACSIKVKDDVDPYRPEYIIPQMMLDAIVQRNQAITETDRNLYDLDIVWGICYSSTRINGNGELVSPALQNVVFPIVEDNQTAKYCNHLASLFEWTEPQQYIRDDISCSHFSKSTNDGIIISQYIEDDLILHNFENPPYLIVNIPRNRVIELDYLGTPVSLEIRSNVDWEIQ